MVFSETIRPTPRSQLFHITANKKDSLDKRWNEMKVKRQIGANEAQCASPSVTQLDQSHVLIDVIARSLSRDY